MDNLPGAQPKIVAIELTNHCNLSCRQCPQATCRIEKGFMDESVFIAAIQRCSGYTELNWRGEPLLHPRLVDFVRLAKQCNNDLNLGFHTNTTRLDERTFNELVAAGIDWIHVSLHTAEACENFRKIQSWNRSAGERVYVYAEVDSSEEELVALSCGIRRGEYQKYHIANWAGYLTGYKVIHNDPREALLDCEYVNKNMVIVAWDGSINACCWDYEQRHVIGHISTMDSVVHHAPYELCRYCLWSHEPTVTDPTEHIENYKEHIIILKDGAYIGLSLNDTSPCTLKGESIAVVQKMIDMRILNEIKDNFLLKCQHS
jgi:hypothetical protein